MESDVVYIAIVPIKRILTFVTYSTFRVDGSSSGKQYRTSLPIDRQISCLTGRCRQKQLHTDNATAIHLATHYLEDDPACPLA